MQSSPFFSRGVTTKNSRRKGHLGMKRMWCSHWNERESSYRLCVLILSEGLNVTLSISREISLSSLFDPDYVETKTRSLIFISKLFPCHLFSPLSLLSFRLWRRHTHINAKCTECTERIDTTDNTERQDKRPILCGFQIFILIRSSTIELNSDWRRENDSKLWVKPLFSVVIIKGRGNLLERRREEWLPIFSPSICSDVEVAEEEMQEVMQVVEEGKEGNEVYARNAKKSNAIETSPNKTRNIYKTGGVISETYTTHDVNITCCFNCSEESRSSTWDDFLSSPFVWSVFTVAHYIQFLQLPEV